jgi:hypothetical protein
MANADDKRTLLPLRRVARVLGLGERVLYNARDRGELDCYSICGRNYLRLSTARDWLARHRRPPGEPKDAS